jgi:hypothetical protein
MRDYVARTSAAINALPAAELIRNLVRPSCIAGCMAAHDQEQVFRDLAFAAKLDKHVFCISWRALEVMGTCWMMRRSPEIDQNGTDWFSAIGKPCSPYLVDVNP